MDCARDMMFGKRLSRPPFGGISAKFVLTVKFFNAKQVDFFV